MDTTAEQKPQIDYPTRWNYRIVCTSESAIRAHIAEFFADRPYELEVGRHSSGGKYVSMHLSLTVNDEAERLSVFDEMSKHETVRFVL